MFKGGEDEPPLNETMVERLKYPNKERVSFNT